MHAVIGNMNYNWDVCNDCGAQQMVWDRDGDIVCTTCGLVKQERYISDEPEWQCFDGDNAECRVERLVEDEEKVPHIEHIERYDEHMQDHIKTLYMYVYEQKKKNVKGQHAYASVCAYIASKFLSRCYTYVDICAHFGVKDTVFWTKYKDVLKLLKEVPGDAGDKYVTVLKSNNDLSRMAHDIQDVFVMSDGFCVWKLLKVANQIYTKVEDTHYFQSCKGSKLCASIMYVACMALKLKVDKKLFCQRFHIAAGTLNKQCDIIHSILSR